MIVEHQHMSPEEAYFVQLYVLTLKKNYDEFFNALQMMRSEIGIKCPVQAARLGRLLHQMGADFEHTLALIATKHSAKMCEGVKVPTVTELIKLMQVSFFKLVDPKDDPPEDKGWFSGHPFEWDKAYKKIQQVHDAQPPAPPLSAMLQALLKFFNNGNDVQINITYIPGFSCKDLPSWPSDVHQNYDDEYYDDDENEDDGPDYGIPY